MEPFLPNKDTTSFVETSSLAPFQPSFEIGKYIRSSFWCRNL